jgi:hypothetical protein
MHQGLYMCGFIFLCGEIYKRARRTQSPTCHICLFQRNESAGACVLQEDLSNKACVRAQRVQKKVNDIALETPEQNALRRAIRDRICAQRPLLNLSPNDGLLVFVRDFSMVFTFPLSTII